LWYVFIDQWRKPIKVRISTDKVRINNDIQTPAQMKIVEYLKTHERIVNKEVQELLGIKDSRALKILKEMTEEGILMKKGKLKGSCHA